jgi:uncharacterized delta-60 repeat protein
MSKYCYCTMLAVVVAMLAHSLAAFAPEVDGSRIWATAIQTDGKILAGGRFRSVNGVARTHIVRLNPDGSSDTSFNPTFYPSLDYDLFAIVLQSDGKILVGGWFDEVNGAIRQRIARLNPDGSLDTTFVPPPGAINWISSIAVQPDGKVVIGGHFWILDGQDRSNIARLNANGSLDSSFDPGLGTDRLVSDIVMQSDGKIVIVGEFSEVDGVPRNRIARLNADGSLDTGFDPGTGPEDHPETSCQCTLGSSMLKTVALQSNSKVLVGGVFRQFDGTTRHGLVRLHTDGGLDTSFDAPLELVEMWWRTDNSTSHAVMIRACIVQQDDKIVVAGLFTTHSGTRLGFARLNSNGTLDTTFGFDGSLGSIFALALQVDGSVVLGGSFNSILLNPVGYVPRSKLARVYPDGSLDDGPPVLALVSPDPVRRGDALTITGSKFASAGSVTVGGVPAAILTNTATEVVVQISPTHPVGPSQTVVVTTPGGTDSSATVDVIQQPPVVSAVAPNPVALGGQLTITGAALDNVLAVTVGGEQLAVLSNTFSEIIVLIDFTHPPGLNQTVVVTTAGGVDHRFSVRVAPTPVVTEISPGRAYQGSSVTIRGFGLAGASVVTVGGMPTSIVWTSESELYVALGNSHPPGPDQVVAVTTPGGTDSSATVTVLALPKTKDSATGCAAGPFGAPLALMAAALCLTTTRRRKRAHNPP